MKPQLKPIDYRLIAGILSLALGAMLENFPQVKSTICHRYPVPDLLPNQLQNNQDN